MAKKKISKIERSRTKYEQELMAKVEKVDPHRPPAWGARPLFRLRLTDPRTSIGYILMDVVAITTIPNTNKAHEERFRKSEPKSGHFEPTKYHDDETWHCLCFSEHDETWRHMSFSGMDLYGDVNQTYEVVS